MKAAGERTRFLLLEPGHAVGETGVNAGIEMVSRLEVFPNPATTVLNLSFSLEAAIQARIELRDETGNLVKDVPYQPYEAGAVSLRIDLEGIPTGVYSIVVLPEGGKRQVARAVVNK